MTRVTILGAGVAGLTCAAELAVRGAEVEIVERADRIGADGASARAGAMLAPWCERESAEPAIARLGAGAADWWAAWVPGVTRQGSLVVAPPRDRAELDRFARRTSGFERVGADGIAELEPDLAGRFRAGLVFFEEAHLCPVCAMRGLARRLEAMGVPLHLGSDGQAGARRAHAVIDCRGYAARDRLAELRGVRGEMALIRCPEIALTRPVRLLHPRIPVYVVPRGEGVYMVGATMIESAAAGPITLRAALELLGAAYALHPGFGEAEILETAAGIRPAFADNLPRVLWREGRLHVNGLYRHGFLCAPALARRAAEHLLEGRELSESCDEDHAERQAV